MPKAITAATKYFLPTTFLIATGDDPEMDQHLDMMAEPLPMPPAKTTASAAKRPAAKAPAASAAKPSAAKASAVSTDKPSVAHAPDFSPSYIAGRG